MLNWQILLTESSPGTYEMRVRYPGAPRGGHRFVRSLPPDFSDFARCDDMHVPKRAWRRPPGDKVDDGLLFCAANLDTLKDIGSRLHDALFRLQLAEVSKDLTGEFLTLRETAAKMASDFRLDIDLTDAPQLARVPWEALYFAEEDLFLGIDTKTNIVRMLSPDHPGPLPAAIEPPIRMLVAVANPLGDLEARTEAADIKARLTGLLDKSCAQYEVQTLPQATRSQLGSRVEDWKPHIVHFIGHGGFDDDKGLIYLHDERDPQKRDPIDSATLRDFVRNDRPWLVVLNSCLSGAAARAEPFGGAAHNLLRVNVPFVVAMQSPISDQAAIRFSQRFYASLTRGDPVAVAVTRGRNAIKGLGEESLRTELITPVLYMSGQADRIGFNQPAEAPPPKSGLMTKVERGVFLLAAIAAIVVVPPTLIQWLSPPKERPSASYASPKGMHRALEGEAAADAEREVATAVAALDAASDDAEGLALAPAKPRSDPVRQLIARPAAARQLSARTVLPVALPRQLSASAIPPPPLPQQTAPPPPLSPSSETAVLHAETGPPSLPTSTSQPVVHNMAGAAMGLSLGVVADVSSRINAIVGLEVDGAPPQLDETGIAAESRRRTQVASIVRRAFGRNESGFRLFRGANFGQQATRRYSDQRAIQMIAPERVQTYGYSGLGGPYEGPGLRVAALTFAPGSVDLSAASAKQLEGVALDARNEARIDLLAVVGNEPAARELARYRLESVLDYLLVRGAPPALLDASQARADAGALAVMESKGVGGLIEIETEDARSVRRRGVRVPVPVVASFAPGSTEPLAERLFDFDFLGEAGPGSDLLIYLVGRVDSEEAAHSATKLADARVRSVAERLRLFGVPQASIMRGAAPARANAPNPYLERRVDASLALKGAERVDVPLAPQALPAATAAALDRLAGWLTQYRYFAVHLGAADAAPDEDLAARTERLRSALRERGIADDRITAEPAAPAGEPAAASTVGTTGPAAASPPDPVEIIIVPLE